MPQRLAAVVEEEEVDHLVEAVVEEAVAEDHQVEDHPVGEDHLEVHLVLNQDKLEEGPNWWETLLKYSMKPATGHSCFCHNGKFTGA